MYKQNSPIWRFTIKWKDETVQPFHKWGCLFFSLGRIAEKVAEREAQHDDVMAVYERLKDIHESNALRGMAPDCYVYNHEDCLSEWLFRLGRRDVKVVYEGALYLDKPELTWGGKTQFHDMVVQVGRPGAEGHFRLADWDPLEPAWDFDSIRSLRFYSISDKK